MKAMKHISEQIEFFLRESSVTPAQLSRESGVHEVYISRLKLRKQKDTSSSNADARRAAMMKLDPKTAARVL